MSIDPNIPTWLPFGIGEHLIKQYNPCFVAHRHSYGNLLPKTGTRLQADIALYKCMKVAGSWFITAAIAFVIVRLAGWAYWKAALK